MSKLVDNIRVVGMEVVANANSGHQGLPSGMAPSAHVLFSEYLKYGKSSNWINRDRFVLSAGHGSALLYTMLHLTGRVKHEELKQFRKLHSKTPGHPESRITDGVECTTGPLGQGLSVSVGMAMAQEYCKTQFNTKEFTLFDHNVFVFCGDGCLQEGVTSEACSLAGHLGLGSLVLVYDDNHTTIDGHTDLNFTESVEKRFSAYNWNVIKVNNGDTGLDEISKAMKSAVEEKNKPTIIITKTTIGYGTKKQGLNSMHGFGTKLEELLEIRKKFGLKEETLNVSDDLYTHYKKVNEKAEKREEEWNKMLKQYSEKEKEKYALLQKFLKKELPTLEEIDKLFPKTETVNATRKFSGSVIDKLAKIAPQLIGGSADLEGSNCTKLTGEKSFQKGDYSGRVLRFGVREHAMAAIVNGFAEYGLGFVPFCATFFVFIGYMAGAMRMSALSKLQVLYILTHDSIFVGEDGPTHQPIEQLAQMRAFPNFNTFRPCGMEEVKAGYYLALKSKETPTAMVLTRQNVEYVEGANMKEALKGGYVVKDCKNPKIVLISSGSEVGLCCKIADEVGARVVSVPEMKIFDSQPMEYKKEVLLDCKVPILSVEAGSTFGWSKFSHAQFGIETFGESGNYKSLQKHFGVNEETLKSKVEKVLNFYKNEKPFNFLNKPQL